MKKGLLSILILCAAITTKTFAQTSADYNYSIAVRGFSMMQLPKILNQTNTQDYTKMVGNGAILKFNDNQISYRISGNYFRNADVQFQNTCETCEIARGKLPITLLKLVLKRISTTPEFNLTLLFDIGYRSNRFSGTLSPANSNVGTSTQSADASKNGLVMTPTLGLKINIIPNLSIFAESSLDFNYSYEKQDLTQQNQAGRNIYTYNKWEFLLNPVSAGIQFNFNSKN